MNTRKRSRKNGFPFPFQFRIGVLCLLAGLFAGCSQPVPGWELVLDGAFRRGMPFGISVSSDERWGYMTEGANISIFDLDEVAAGNTEPVERVPLNALGMVLLPDGRGGPADRIFVAGGRHGLVKVEKSSSGSWRQVTLDDGSNPARGYYAGQRFCTDIGTIRLPGHGAVLLALYGASGAELPEQGAPDPGVDGNRRGGNELRGYSLRTARGVTNGINMLPRLFSVRLSGQRSSLPDGSWPVAISMTVSPSTKPGDPKALYVALGTAGVTRVHFDAVTGQPEVAGDDLVFGYDETPFSDIDLHEDFPDQSARVMDLVAVGSCLYLAADAAGLVEVNIGEGSEWPPKSFHQVSLNPSGSPADLGAYARRVDAVRTSDGTIHVAVAGNLKTAQIQGGMPSNPTGTIGFDGAVGGTGVKCHSAKDERGLYLFERGPAGLELPAGFTTSANEIIQYQLDLRRDADGIRIYTDKFSKIAGTTLSNMNEEFRVESTGGNVTSDGMVLESNPDVMIFGNDAGADFMGALRYIAGGNPGEGQIEAIPGTRTDSPMNPFVGGIFAGTQWVSDSPSGSFGPQWMIQGKRFSANYTPQPGGTGTWDNVAAPCWLVSNFTPGETNAAGEFNRSYWQVPSPSDIDGKKGGDYMGAAYDDLSGNEYVFFSRARSRQGLLYTTRNEIENAASAADAVPGSHLDLSLTPLWTHAEDFASEPQGRVQPLTLNVRVFSWNPGAGSGQQSSPETVVAVVAGYTGPDRTDGVPVFRPKILFYRIDSMGSYADGTLEPTEAIGLSDGLAAEIEIVDLDAPDGTGSRSYAFVTDFSGKVHVFDLADLFPGGAAASAPLTPCAVWETPVSAFDGARENIMDLEVVYIISEARWYAYLSHWRRGITILDITDPHKPYEVSGSPVLTPGWAEGLELRREPFLPTTEVRVLDSRNVPVTALIVADHACSALVYRWR